VGLGTGFGADAVRRLNARGDDILRRLGYFDVIGDIYRGDGTGSSLVDVAVDKNGVYSVLDRSNGRIFTYDHDGNLLDIFGGIGFRMGLLQSPVAMDYVEDSIVVIDNFMQNITVYRPTAYGLAVRQATYLYYLGDYEGSAEYWQVVLDHNANSDLAYIGLGRIYMRDRDFARAREYFRFANAHTY
jgi:tetratricopeptide (TPR) repeat protein